MASIRPNAIYLTKSTFKICEFNYLFETPYTDVSDLLVSNVDLRINRGLITHFDYIASELSIFRNVTLDTICGNSTCSRNLFIVNMNGRYEFYNLTVKSFLGHSTSVLRLMGGSMFVKDSHF